MELKISNRLALIATALYIYFVTAQASAKHRIAPRPPPTPPCIMEGRLRNRDQVDVDIHDQKPTLPQTLNCSSVCC